jgi:hypothetical protein
VSHDYLLLPPATVGQIRPWTIPTPSVKAMVGVDPAVEDARLHAGEVTAPSPITLELQPVVCHRDSLPTSLLRGWVVEVVLG